MIEEFAGVRGMAQGEFPDLSHTSKIMKFARDPRIELTRASGWGR
jgi:hypothetical protein